RLRGAGEDFVWNGTNVTRQSRARVLRLLRDYGARVEAVYIEPTPDVLAQQNRSREATVPQAVIDGLARKLEPPTHGEVHEVHYVCANGA
ncbi:MAG: AAA family ATPase, partial [Pseudomonadota bacterium]